MRITRLPDSSRDEPADSPERQVVGSHEKRSATIRLCLLEAVVRTIQRSYGEGYDNDHLAQTQATIIRSQI